MSNTYLLSAKNTYTDNIERLVNTLNGAAETIQNIVPSELLDGTAADKQAAAFMQTTKASPEYEASKIASATDIRRINRDLSVVHMSRLDRVAAFLTQLNDKLSDDNINSLYPGLNL